jgi:hypothetical protein
MDPILFKLYIYISVSLRSSRLTECAVDLVHKDDIAFLNIRNFSQVEVLLLLLWSSWVQILARTDVYYFT